MQKQELLKRLSERTDLSKKQVEEVLNAFQMEVIGLLDPNLPFSEQNDVISLPLLGNFSVKETKDRKGINPATGEKIDIKGYRTIGFKAKPSVKEYEFPLKLKLK